MQNDLYSKIVRERTSLEELGLKIPGFRGYMEMTARRQADRMIRDDVARKLQTQLSRLVNIEKMLLDAGGLSYMSKTRSAKTKFQTFIDRITSDTAGYSGFFDAVKIDEEDLAVIYSFDAALIDYADKLAEKLNALEQAAAANEGIDAQIRELDALTVEANQAYNLRENVLLGIE
ncbi:MAG: hypothetical protein EHM39_07890 [Chloroflexi bacterium]|nr:MAG: hypothetical protein EHM39_07890 [Chloroflexota bacterium]